MARKIKRQENIFRSRQRAQSRVAMMKKTTMLTGKTTPMRPRVMTASPASAAKPHMPQVGLMALFQARRKRRKAAVSSRPKMASGIMMRVKRKMPMEVQVVRPA